ncbi:MAG: RHS repeat-associated core domain-containing protein [Eubacterium sp.]|nr:RHS repeat-associated core domain-containing protein [Eubacterium sp.]
MGDVIAIADKNGDVLVEYNYDEWGIIESIKTVYENDEFSLAIANANPLRYRGYYYDNETGYYYLQSRYYDPSICRFINADTYVYAQFHKDDTVGLNIFAYCNNNPINHSDPTGHWAEKYKKFKWTSKGFNLEVKLAFINKSFCKIYALDILRLKKAGFKYKGMTATRMAAELYFHAVLYYATNALLKVGVKKQTIKDWNKSAKHMEINNNDKRFVWFYAVWGLSSVLINCYL